MTLTDRCMAAYCDAAPGAVCNRLATRATLKHTAAELVVAGHPDAAHWLLSQLVAEVIPLRPTPGDAA